MFYCEMLILKLTIKPSSLHVNTIPTPTFRRLFFGISTTVLRFLPSKCRRNTIEQLELVWSGVVQKQRNQYVIFVMSVDVTLFRNI